MQVGVLFLRAFNRELAPGGVPTRVVIENAGNLIPRGVLRFFASRLAPTVKLDQLNAEELRALVTQGWSAAAYSSDRWSMRCANPCLPGRKEGFARITRKSE